MVKQQVFYKYKSLDNFEFLLDLILRERLYAAQHHELNDPMEGVVKIDGTIPKDKEQEWDELIKTFRIVCFSRDKDHPLMWSHYANGARGCVIEFQLIDDQQVHKVSYLKKPILTERHINREKEMFDLTDYMGTWYKALSMFLLLILGGAAIEIDLYAQQRKSQEIFKLIISLVLLVGGLFFGALSESIESSLELPAKVIAVPALLFNILGAFGLIQWIMER